MNALPKILTFCIALPFLFSGCGIQAVEIESEAQAAEKGVPYQTILGISGGEAALTDFIADHGCTRADRSMLCKTAGMALWMDANEIVETVYLYLNNSNGFTPYQGELPFGLKFYDTMGAVEYKLNMQGIGMNGLPDEAGAPDHMHYHAHYKKVGMTVIYNVPSADEDAMVYAILIKNRVVSE